MEPLESATSSAAEKLILHWDSTATEELRDKMIFTSSRLQIDRYLNTVDEFQKSMDSAALGDSSPSSPAASSALQIAMDRLEDEFRYILLSHTSPIEPDTLSESTSQKFESKDEIPGINFDRQLEHQDSNSSTTSSYFKSSNSLRGVDLITNDAVYDLRCIAERMIAAGYLRECIQVCASVRKSAADASLRKLKVEKLSIGDIQRLEWKTMETKIWRWIRAAKIVSDKDRRKLRHICELNQK